jgi:hypothetical protein
MKDPGRDPPAQERARRGWLGVLGGCARFRFVASLVVLGVAALYVWACLPSGRPSADLRLVGYQTRGDSIVATLLLTNTGASALIYRDSVSGAWCEVSARVHGSMTNFGSGLEVSSMSWDVDLLPACSARFGVVLPIGTEAWHYRAWVGREGARLRMYRCLVPAGIWSRATRISSWFIRLFPDNGSNAGQIPSAEFEIPTNSTPGGHQVFAGQRGMIPLPPSLPTAPSPPTLKREKA